MYIRNSASGSDVYTNKVSIYLKKNDPAPGTPESAFYWNPCIWTFFCFSNGYFFKDNFLNIFLPVKKDTITVYARIYTYYIPIMSSYMVELRSRSPLRWCDPIPLWPITASGFNAFSFVRNKYLSGRAKKIRGGFLVLNSIIFITFVCLLFLFVSFVL